MINCIVYGVEKNTGKTVYAKAKRDKLEFGWEDAVGALVKYYSPDEASKIRLDRATHLINDLYYGNPKMVNASNYWIEDIRIEIVEG